MSDENNTWHAIDVEAEFEKAWADMAQNPCNKESFRKVWMYKYSRPKEPDPVGWMVQWKAPGKAFPCTEKDAVALFKMLGATITPLYEKP